MELPVCVEVVDDAGSRGLPLAKAGQQAEAQKNRVKRASIHCNTPRQNPFLKAEKNSKLVSIGNTILSGNQPLWV
jgi:hypothetical protein